MFQRAVEISKAAIHHPGRILPWVYRKGVVKPKRYIDGYLLPTYFQSPYGEPFSKVQLDVGDLWMPATTKGLPLDLRRDKAREPITTAAYQEALLELNRLTPEACILEAGANIGYYVLLATNTMPRSTILAAELDEKNVSFLRKNIEENTISDRVVLKHTVLNDGSKESVTVHESVASNCHTIRPDDDEWFSGRTYQARPETADDLVEGVGVDPGNVHAIRMDVQGAEAEILRGAEGILQNRPMVLNVEIHPQRLDDGELEFLLSILDEYSVRSVAQKDQQFSAEELTNASDYRYLEVVATAGF